MTQLPPVTQRWAALLGTEVAGVRWERRDQAGLVLPGGVEVFAKATGLGTYGRRCQDAEVAGLR